MKRVILICIILFATYNIYAQSNSEKMGDTAFSMGNYADAIELYDAAIILSKDRVDKIQAKRSKAAKCNSLKKTGDSLYASKEYEESKSKYLQLKSLNPTDKSVSDKLAILDRLITERKSQEAKAEKMAQIENSYYDALRLGVEALEKFREKYPDSEQIHKTDVAINALKMEKYSCSPTEISLYNQIGNDFKRIGDTDKARKFYDFSASLANPEGLYLKALTYDNITAIEPLSLLVLSSVEGYEPAKDKLIAIKGDNKYDTEVAKRLYKHLCNYRSSLESYVYLYENRGYYPIDRLELADVAKEHYRNLTTINKMKDDDNLIYHFATIIEKVNMEPKQLYQLAASKGNIDAVRWIYNQEKNSLNAEGRRAYENFLEDFNNEMYKSYLKYLKGDEMSSRDWSRVGIYDYDKHEELLSRSFSMNYNYEVKSFKKFIKRYNDTPWDKDVVDYIKQKVAYYSPEYSKRILKIISKLNTSENQYDIAGNPTYKMVKAGYTENPHAYIKSVSRELQLWTHFRSSSAKTSTKPSTNSSKVTTSYSPSNVNLVVGQYYEHLGGIVFYLDGTNRHGKVMSIKHTTQAMDKNSAVRWMNSNCGAGWRFPSVDELYILQQKQSVINRTYCQINRNKVIIDNYNIHWTDAGYCLSIGNAWRKKTTGELRSKTTGGVLAVKDF